MSTTLDLTICVSRFVFSVSIVRSLSFSLRDTNTNNIVEGLESIRITRFLYANGITKR